MKSVFPVASEHVEARILSQVERGLFKAIEGRLQRVNYNKKEIAVVADGEIRYFQVDPDSQLWFDDQRTILRCFHPLDQVKVIFQEGQPNAVKAMYAWEKQVA